MDRNRSILVVGASFALLAAGIALTVLLRQQEKEQTAADIEGMEAMMEQVETISEPIDLPKRIKKTSRAARNGHVKSGATEA